MIGYGKIVFLAGLVDLGQHDDQNWKTDITFQLKKLGFTVINPATTFIVTRPTNDEDTKKLAYKVRAINEYAMKNSDYIIARITERMSVGTVTELVLCHNYGKRCVIVWDSDVEPPLYLFTFDLPVVRSFDEAVEHIKLCEE
jgi:hypothetical protein